MKTEFVATRFSPSAISSLVDNSTSSLLVRIYPVSGVEKPYELSESLLHVGRDINCSLVLSDDSVSRRHAMIERCDAGYVISDLSSTNGTYINEERIETARKLGSGDRVRFGNQIFKYISADQIEVKYHEVIFNLMTTDGLTAVHNKRYFLETLKREIQQSRRSGTPLCLLMLDLDKFKSVNDTYGHLAGDSVLVEFARRAKSALRGGDLLARFGGEEFALLLTRTPLGDAVQVAERIRQLIADTPVSFEEHQISITVSVGLSFHHCSVDFDASKLLSEADEQLYIAKQSGRNQVRYLQCHDRQTSSPM